MPLVFVVDGIAERRSIVQYALEQAGFAGWRVMGASQYGSDHERDLSRSQRNADALIGTGVNHGPVFTDFVVGKQHDACAGQSRTLPDLTAEINSISIGQLRRDDHGGRTLLLGVVQRMRRSKSFDLIAGDILINSSAMTVAVRGKEITTTTLEFRLIHYMARHQGEAFTRDALLDAVWGDLQFVTPRSVDACIRRIRRKIEPNSSSPTFLKSVRGIGYKLDATPVWQTSADCECAACSGARMRTKAGPMRQVGRALNTQDRPSKDSGRTFAS
jgi:DNA-binding winged helix-turn-helix (wHTH) protein